VPSGGIKFVVITMPFYPYITTRVNREYLWGRQKYDQTVFTFKLNHWFNVAKE